MTDNDIYTAMQSIVATVTGLAGDHVIPADDNEEAPSGPYASIKVGSGRGQRGQANIIKSNTALVSSPIGDVRDVDHDVRAQLTVDVAINFYRGSALESASMMYQANKIPSISAQLFTAGIGWKGAGVINNLTALQSKEMEERALITITLLYERSQTATTNAIYSVQVIAEDANGDIIQTETIDAPVGV